MVIRAGGVYRTCIGTELRHSFFTPAQLSIAPDGHPIFRDKPTDADCSEFRLRHGDVVIVCSDGVTDNLYESEILNIVMDFGYAAPVEDIAASIVRSAVRMMKKGDSMSPFASRANSEGWLLSINILVRGSQAPRERLRVSDISPRRVWLLLDSHPQVLDSMNLKRCFMHGGEQEYALLEAKLTM